MPTQNACLGALDGGAPEVDRKTFDNVVFYTRVVAVPKRRPAAEEAERNGAELFLSSGCAACHTPTQSTGESDIGALSNQTIHPFTDLLLHDMGEGLSDGRPDFDAGPTEWRTAPLWGIGLYGEVNGHTRYLHDGRARNLEEAILWHGGEAADAQSAYRRDAEVRSGRPHHLPQDPLTASGTAHATFTSNRAPRRRADDRRRARWPPDAAATTRGRNRPGTAHRQVTGPRRSSWSSTRSSLPPTAPRRTPRPLRGTRS